MLLHNERDLTDRKDPPLAGHSEVAGECFTN